jgi:hypothetical protein
MRCRYCQRRIPILRKLSDAEFCSDEHRLLFLAEQERLALARLVEAQQRFAQEALQVTRSARPHQEVIAPMASFVWNGPWEQAGNPAAAGQAAPLPYKESVHLPRLEDSGVAATARRPSRLHRPRAAAASGALAVVDDRRLWPAPPAPPPAAPCALPAFRLRLSAHLPQGQAEPYRFRIPGPETGSPVFVPACVNFTPGASWILPQSRLRPAPPVADLAAAVTAPAARSGYGVLVLKSAIPPAGNEALPVRLPATGAILKPLAPGFFRESASGADLSAVAAAEWTVLEVKAAPSGAPGWRVDAPPAAPAPCVLLPGGAGRVEASRTLSLQADLADLSGPASRTQDFGVRPHEAGLAAISAGKPCRLPGLNVRRGCALNHADFEAFDLAVAAVPLSLEPRSAAPPARASVQLPLADGAALAPAALPSALAPVCSSQIAWVDSSAGLRAAGSGPVAFEPEAPRTPESVLAVSGANFEAPSRMAWLAFAAAPVDQEAAPEALSGRLEWPSRTPAAPRLRLEPCPPAAVTGEDLTVPLPERLAALSALSRFWSAAPAEMRWAAAILPLVFGLIWYSAGDRPRRGEDGRVETAAASRPLAQFVKARWESVREGIAERAGVELFDDFRSGLSSWQGGKDWAESWSYDNAGFVRAGALALFSPSLEMADYEFEFLGRIEKKALSWVVRAQDTRNYHALKIVITRPGPLPSIALVRSAVIAGKEGPQTRIPLALTVTNDTLYRVKTTVRGNSFTVSVQGRVVATWSDERLRRGGVGFFNSKGEQSLLRWVTVTHQYDTLGKLCAYLAPFSIPSRKGD